MKKYDEYDDMGDKIVFWFLIILIITYFIFSH